MYETLTRYDDYILNTNKQTNKQITQTNNTNKQTVNTNTNWQTITNDKTDPRRELTAVIINEASFVIVW